MLLRLSEATRANSGGKAGTLGSLLREGLPVPDGFVVPSGDQSVGPEIGGSLHSAVAGELARLGDPVVAVRSSAANEDTAEASAAGQYESIIGVRGTEQVCQAVTACRASAHATRVGDYWTQVSDSDSSSMPEMPEMAVLVQPVVTAEVSGVMFTPQQQGDPTRIEASWGLGVSVVGGTVTPDTYEVATDGAISRTVGSKHTRADLNCEHGGVATSIVAAGRREVCVLDDVTVTELLALGGRIAGILDGPQDIEWAVADGAVWVLQARPITATLPAYRATATSGPAEELTGTPGSHGTVTTTARIVCGPSDFSTVRAGEVVVCPYTDPAWTPLFTIAVGVITETGGALSHAAIVAREYGIPAVLGVTDATTRIQNGARIALDGTAGTITVL